MSAEGSRVVVDASVGLKWVVDEALSLEAITLVNAHSLHVPDLFWVEAANALASKVRRGELERGAATDAWLDLVEAPLETVPCTPKRVEAALELAHDLAHPVYDCVYLATALELGGTFVTADRRLGARLAQRPALARRVVTLGD